MLPSILDGAGWHVARALVVPDNLFQLTLPPDSPELNAVEDVWQNLRACWRAINVFDSYEAIVNASAAPPETASPPTQMP